MLYIYICSKIHWCYQNLTTNTINSIILYTQSPITLSLQNFGFGNLLCSTTANVPLTLDLLFYHLYKLMIDIFIRKNNSELCLYFFQPFCIHKCLQIVMRHVNNLMQLYINTKELFCSFSMGS